MWFFFQREEVLANTGLAFLSSTSYWELSEGLHATPRPHPITLFVVLFESVATASPLTGALGKGSWLLAGSYCREFLVFLKNVFNDSGWPQDKHPPHPSWETLGGVEHQANLCKCSPLPRRRTLLSPYFHVVPVSKDRSQSHLLNTRSFLPKVYFLRFPPPAEMQSPPFQFRPPLEHFSSSPAGYSNYSWWWWWAQQVCAGPCVLFFVSRTCPVDSV